MGGYGSGRQRRAHVTTECMALDTTAFRKQGYLTGPTLLKGGTLHFSWTAKPFEKKWGASPVPTPEKHSLSFVIRRDACQTSGSLTLHYAVKVGEASPVSMQHDIPLVTTCPQYGGVRWWFFAPCCGRRVRVLYVPSYGQRGQIRPQCRGCLDLNYASQRQSYIERHKTYERYLLANYGYCWAAHEYQSLKQHYFKVTPQWAAIVQRSLAVRHLEMLKRLLACERLNLRRHLHALRSLRSQDDRRLYIDILKGSYGEQYCADLRRMFCVDGVPFGTPSMQTPAPALEELPSLEELEEAYLKEAEAARDDVAPDTLKNYDILMDVRMLLACKRDVEEQLEYLASR